MNKISELEKAFNQLMVFNEENLHFSSLLIKKKEELEHLVSELES